jgi:hypothetical protein
LGDDRRRAGMSSGFVVAVLVLGLALAAGGATAAALGHAPPRLLLRGLLALQLLLLAQAAVVVVRLVQGAQAQESGAFVGYLVFSLLLLPGGLALSADEHSRYGTLVLAVAALVVAVVELRMVATWR